MPRSSLLLLPAVVAAIAVPVSPALAGEDPPPAPPAPVAPVTPVTPVAPVTPIVSATLRASQGCVSSGSRTKAAVSGQGIASVTYFADGKLVKTVTHPDSTGRYSILMSCARFSVGANRAKAVVAFQTGAQQTLRFQVTRSVRSTARFAG